MTALGVHAHPRFKLGLAPHGKTDDELLALKWTATSVPSFGTKVDRLAAIQMALDDNDRLGDCGPTSVDNHDRVTTLVELGQEIDATIGEVLDLYSRSSQPPFDPATGANDNGVDMATMMGAVRTGGLAGRKVVAYARLRDTSDPSVYAAIDIFGAVLFAVNLQTAQQSQSDQSNPTWDYQQGSSDWGGHAVCAGAYDTATGAIDVVSWGMRVHTTAGFRAHQLQEVWVPIWPELLASDKFVANVDVEQLAVDFHALTGNTLPVPAPSPTPVPGPAPSPSPSGGASFLVNDPTVVARIDRLATRKGVTRDAWLTSHLEHYFGIVDLVGGFE